MRVTGKNGTILLGTAVPGSPPVAVTVTDWELNFTPLLEAGMRETLMRSQEGWTLASEAVPGALGIMAMPPRRFLLSGLAVTCKEAEEVLACRHGRGIVSLRSDYRGARFCLDDVEVTPGEAQLIAEGRPPLTVLTPRIWARPLTLEELMRDE